MFPGVGYLTISLGIMPPGEGPPIPPCCPSKPSPPMGNFWFGVPKGMSNKDNMTTCHTFGKTDFRGKTKRKMSETAPKGFIEGRFLTRFFTLQPTKLYKQQGKKLINFNML
jgi:hypothetical protein